MCFVTDLRLLVFAHLLRGGMQNAIYPIDRSIVMDFTRSKREILNSKPYGEQRCVYMGHRAGGLGPPTFGSKVWRMGFKV